MKPSGEIVEGTLAAWKLVNEGKMLEEDAFSLKVFLETMAANLRSEKYQWNDKDDTLPAGWKSRFANEKKMFILSPDCQVFHSRKAGLQHMIKEHFEEKEIATMQSLLIKHEGWKFHENLPKHWMFKLTICRTKSDISFLTEEGIEFSSYSQASDHIKERFTEEEQIKFSRFCEEFSQNNRLSMYKWNEKDTSLPGGWRSRIVEGSSDKQFFLSPTNQQFTQRSAILRHMVEEGSYSREDIDLARQSLALQGWEQHSGLPQAWWYKRKGQGSKHSDIFTFVKPDGSLVEGTNAAWQLVANQGQLPEEEAFSLKVFLETLAASQRSERYDWKEGGKSLPEGWKSRQSGAKEFFLSPDGAMVSSRKAGLRHLVKEGADHKDIEAMRNLLRFEGWKRSSSLPKNWLMRRSKKSGWCFLTEVGDEFKSLKLALEFLHTLGAAAKEDFKRLNKLNNCSKKAEPGKSAQVEAGGGDGKEWRDDQSLPRGWKTRRAIQRGVGTVEVFLGPSNRQIYGRAALLDHLLTSNKVKSLDSGEVARLAASLDWKTLKAEKREELQARVTKCLKQSEKSKLQNS